MNGRAWLLWALLAACTFMAGCSAAPPAKEPPKTPSDWIALPRPK